MSLSFSMKYTYLAFFQRCFSPRGWDRGQVVFVDLLALQYPDQNHCDVFVKRKNSTTPEQLPGEKCSILEEVSLLTNMRVCNNKVQVPSNAFLSNSYNTQLSQYYESSKMY